MAGSNTDDDTPLGLLKSSPKEQTSDKGPTGPMESSGGGEIVDKVWTISGRMCVRESEILGDGVHCDRHLKGIEVKVSASDLGADGPWIEWGTVRTDSTGDFSLRKTNNGKERFFRVQARLVSDDLEVNDSKLNDVMALDPFDRNWRTVWKSDIKRSGPPVSAGTCVFAAGGRYDLGNETFRRQALIWYVLRTVIDRLVQEDAWFALKRKIAAIYPAHAVGGTSYANGVTRMIYLHQGTPDDDWHPVTVVHEFMHLWNYDHNHGTINWLGAICSLRGDDPVDLQTHNSQENPNVAFAEGCSNWASNALRHVIWGVRQRRPLNRWHVANVLRLNTLENAEKSEHTVDSALRLLSCGTNRGWWSHLFGTADAAPKNLIDGYASEVGVAKLDRLDVPAGVNSLSPFDVLRTFRASPSTGWDTDLQVGNVDYGIVRFIDRAVDIHHLGEDVRLMLKRCLDPLATDEPRDALPSKAKA